MAEPWLLGLVADNAVDLLSVEDGQDRYVYLSSSCERLLGWKATDLYGGLIGTLHHPADAPHVARQRDFLRGELPLLMCYRYRIRCRGGQYRWVESRSRRSEESLSHVVTVTRDVEDQVRQLQELERLATYDALTGLVNRRAIEAALHSELSRSRRQGRTLSVALLDLDGFKRINDSHGHIEGDKLLRTLGACVTQSKRPYDIAGRWGGDELVVLLPDTEPGEAIAVLRRMRKEMAHAMPGITVSMGLSSSSENASVCELLTAADAALYQVKRCGGDAIAAWDDIRPGTS